MAVRNKGIFPKESKIFFKQSSRLDCTLIQQMYCRVRSGQYRISLQKRHLNMFSRTSEWQEDSPRNNSQTKFLKRQILTDSIVTNT